MSGVFQKACVGVVLALGYSTMSYAAQDAPLMAGDAANGKKIYQSKCTACHVSKFGGDGTGIHTRADRRIKTLEGLIGQVKECNDELKSGFTPDQVRDVVAYLHGSFYKNTK